MKELLKSPLTLWLFWVFNFLKWRPRKVYLDYMSMAENSTLGRYVRLYKHAHVKNSEIGDYTYIARHSHIENATIGRFCSIGAEVLIGGGMHPTDQKSTHPGFYSGQHYVRFREQFQPFTEYKKVTIGHDVWIGQRSVILDGITIGNGAIIAAGSVVTHNVKPFRIVGGVPASTIGERPVKDEGWYFENTRTK
jgi:acetyltransferase-like isoleucine patch superfamily enzyme